MKDNSDFRKEVNSKKIECPTCGHDSFLVTQRIEEIPFFGEVLETFANCSSCGYSKTDILSLEEKDSTSQEVKISSVGDLNRRVVKSKYCKISIPEMGLEIDPGSDSQGYVTNLEGLLDRILDNLKNVSKVKSEDEDRFEEIVNFLKKVKSGDEEVTVKFEDETGQSLIAGTED